MSVATWVGGARGQMIGLWQQPLYRTGYLLTANSLLSGVVGLVFWVFAARLYPAAVVGTDSAAISAMSFLAGLAQLNMMSALLRFVPDAPHLARRLVGGAFLLAGVLSGVAAIVFLAGMSLWSPGLTHLFDSASMRVWFVVATAAWTVWVLQSSALVALGRSVAVPIVNLAFAVLKAALVVLAAGLLFGGGIWLSWTFATVAAVLATQWYIHSRAMPARTTTPPADGATTITRRDLASYVGPDYLGFLGWTAALQLSPVLVFDLTGARRGAVFSLVWQIGGALYLLASSFGQSLVAHGRRDPAGIEVHYRKALRQSMLLLIPAVVVLVAGAPLVLAPFGGWYASHGANVLRLVALSTIPNTVQTLQIARARVLRNMRTVAVALCTLSALVLALTVLLVPRIGLAGAGLAWVAAEVLVVTGVGVWHRHRQGPQRGSTSGHAAPWRTTASLRQHALRPPRGRHRPVRRPAAAVLAESNRRDRRPYRPLIRP